MSAIEFGGIAWREVFADAGRVGEFCMPSKIRPKGRHLVANYNGKAVTLQPSNPDHVAMVREWLGDKPVRNLNKTNRNE